MPAGLTLMDAPHRIARTHAAEAAVRAALARAERVAWIVPTQAMATATKKRLADAGTILLGVDVCTLASWTADRWALYGDGREVVAGPQRALYVRRALKEGAFACGSLGTPGIAATLEGVARDAAGLVGPDATVDGLSAAQRELLGACRGYWDLLDQHGLIELGEAARILCDAMPRAGWCHLVVEGCWDVPAPLRPILLHAAGTRGLTVVGTLGENPADALERVFARDLADDCAARGVQVERTAADADDPWQSPELSELAGRLFAPAGPAVTSRGDVRACLPAGRYARAELLARQIAQLVDRDGVAPRDIVIACSDPLALASSVAGRLAEHAGRGIGVAAQGKVALQDTQAGRFVAGWWDLLEQTSLTGDDPRPDLDPLAADLARNPLGGLGSSKASRLDKEWRGMRATSARGYALDLTRAMAERDAQTDSPAEDADAGPGDLPNEPLTHADVLSRAADAAAAGFGAQALLEQTAGTAVVQAVADYRDVFGRLPDARSLRDLLARTAVPSRWLSVPPDDISAQRDARVLRSNPNAVRFVRMADLDAVSCQALILCDLTADDLPVSVRGDARDALWSALGLPAAPTALDCLRRQMRAALECAGRLLVLERPLNNVDAGALRPCALLEELLDCYRDDPSDLAGLDKTTGLPKAANIPYMTLGEERFSELASPVTYAPATFGLKAASSLPLEPSSFELISAVNRPWSPSALELLISCPLRWLYERRLPSRSLDAAFDAQAIGSFNHRVLQLFHDRMPHELGIRRIDDQTPRQLWQPLLSSCFAEVLQGGEGLDVPLVAVNELERRKLDLIARQLAACVERDAKLPAGFFPVWSELPFGDETPVMLGDVRLHGTIDRIDVDDERGLALVVDYKGSLSPGHAPVQPSKDAPEEPVADPLPHHSQILMYMAALRQLKPDIATVGGLYVSYSRNAAAGFLDTAAFGMLDNAKGAYLGRANCAVPLARDGSNGLDGLLSLVCQTASDAVAGLARGDVAPRPRFGKASCANCPVADCPERMG